MAAAEIDAMCAQLKEAWAAGDVDKVMSFYTDDCKFMYSDVPGCLEGKEQLRGKMQREIEASDNIELHVIDRTIGENMASEMGNFSSKVKGQDKVITGRYLATFVKRDGKWLFKYDMDIMPTM